jgi:hypothetical protein
MSFRTGDVANDIGPDEAEADGFVGPKVGRQRSMARSLRYRQNALAGDPNLRRNPEGWGQFSSFLCHSSLADTRYASLLSPRTEKNWLPASPVRKLITASSQMALTAAQSRSDCSIG